MSQFKSDFLRVLSERGFIHQVSEPEALDALASSKQITAYIGYDCTAPSLHVGHLLPTMMLYWMQQTGHRPIALMGGGTTRVGDPSGKDESRRILTEEVINENLRSIRTTFSKFLTFGEGPGDAIMANNADWLNTLNYIDFCATWDGTSRSIACCPSTRSSCDSSVSRNCPSSNSIT